jgi:hypothetical protein
VHNIELFEPAGSQRRTTEIEIFADEIKPFKNRIGETWLYLAILIIPIRKKERLLERLLAPRKRIPCDSEIKCHDLDKSTKRILAEKWIDVVLRDKDEKSLYFDVLGLNLSKLHLPTFGDEQFGNIYNRFFRSCVLHGINTCFSNRNVTVLNIFHDNGDQSNHEFFPWHCIYCIEGQSKRIEFSNKQIVFINSDHREPDGGIESHFIQLIDLLVGLSSHCLDFVSKNQARTKIAQKYLPLLERMMKNPMNVNSSYGHTKKYLISFFPKKQLSAKQLLNPLERQLSGFYQTRPLLLKDHLSNQQTLFS